MMHRLVLIIVLLATPAMAQNVIPPAQYDVLYQGKLTLERSSSQSDIRISCPYSPFLFLLGCSRHIGEGECYILMADDGFITALGMLPEMVFRHEIAHCNGWPQSHPR